MLIFTPGLAVKVWECNDRNEQKAESSDKPKRLNKAGPVRLWQERISIITKNYFRVSTSKEGSVIGMGEQFGWNRKIK